MSRTAAIGITIGAGLIVGLQAPANAALSHHVGDLGAAFVSIAVAFTLISVLLVSAGHPGRLSGLGSARPEQFLGGVGAVAVVTAGLIAVRTLGAGAVVALLVCAQLVVAILADRFGWFGLHHVGIGAGRVFGLALVVAGTVLLTRS
jgi:bacterial/archaeal transporter family-2 protein